MKLSYPIIDLHTHLRGDCLLAQQLKERLFLNPKKIIESSRYKLDLI